MTLSSSRSPPESINSSSPAESRYSWSSS